MKAVIQVVREASVTVENKVIARIGKGMLVFVCFDKFEDQGQVDTFAQRLCQIRVFDNREGKIDRSVIDLGAEILIVSQFTLAARLEGNTFSFFKALPYNEAKIVYDEFMKVLRGQYNKVQEGIFGAEMQVALVNDGPVTFLLEK